MPAPDTTPEADLALLAEAAAEAGRVAMSFWQRNPKAWDKGGDHGPVSEADLAVDAILKEWLCNARPGYGWLSEETPDDLARLACDQVFVVDPIDGTRAFLAGEDGFAVSLAVASAGAVTAALVHLPARGLTYAAITGGPASRNGAPVAVSQRTDLTGADVLATRAAMAPEHWPGGVPDLKRSFRTSLAWRLCRVAEGRHDAMFTFREAWEWDIAAGSLIAERAGCRVTDRSGAPLRFNAPHPRAPGVIAAPPALHGAILNQLRA
ncbi:3'(2'),5'-bisphosphate nucleotidase CysQ [Rhodobacter sp. Har01]|uniref:3'(2'),5'-bisphosphate nucleotidase CysQ n=1 Tax=Rhodobacter sp. Har01 TaxID=2883999 RepID=UPI001D075C24|nr:3'(2'),5'-bisphosphate nucleotidase CysQ [Rhodobacter sp. Har01]MCB6179403.1 3'(2'),5'-bisphosphate nucleotidase CysQ [Rhodobacter sp. Har01]